MIWARLCSPSLPVSDLLSSQATSAWFAAWPYILMSRGSVELFKAGSDGAAGELETHPKRAGRTDGVQSDSKQARNKPSFPSSGLNLQPPTLRPVRIFSWLPRNPVCGISFLKKQYFKPCIGAKWCFCCWWSSCTSWAQKVKPSFIEKMSAWRPNCGDVTVSCSVYLTLCSWKEI